MNVLVTGGTGFVGHELVKRLCARDDQVTILTRTPQAARPARAGVTYAGWPVDVARFDAVVNLAGAGVADRRWSAAYKAEIRSSRIDTTRQLVEALARSTTRPRVLVSASAIGWYGDRGEEELTEESPPGTDFLAQLCVDWEAEARRAEALGVRVAIVRIGVVLGRAGGALKQLLPIFRLGLGGPLGSGKAWFPWVHLDDVCSLIVHALDDARARGALNAVSPGIVRNKAFSATLGRVLRRPAILPAPPIALRIVLGEIGSVLTASQRVVPGRPLDLGFPFRFPVLEPALRDLLAAR